MSLMGKQSLAFFGFLILLLVSVGNGEAKRSRRTGGGAWWASYPLPERNWIRSGVWKFGSTEMDRYYHTFQCPVMKRTNPRLLVGWSSAQEALGNGYQPCPRCQPFDPRADKSPGAALKRMFEASANMSRRSQEAVARGDLVMASRYLVGAWIAYGDALMRLAEMEKQAGRLENANQLYQRAAQAYANSRTAMPPVPEFGQAPGRAEGGGAPVAGGAGPAGPGGPPGTPGGGMAAPGGGGAPMVPPGAGPPAVR